MFTNHHETVEYPFFATFYHLGIENDKPLDQQKEEKKISFECKCDISDQETGLNSDKMTLFFPFDHTKEELRIVIGASVEVESYGLIQRGRVIGVFPSQLGGVKVICSRI